LIPRTLAFVLASAALPLLCAPPSALGAITIDLGSTSAIALLGSRSEEQFGYSSASGDVDGDGASELIVGAPGYASGKDDPHAGAVYVFDRDVLAALGSPAVGADVALWMVRGGTRGERFGATVAAADVDGDGIDDLIVGAPSWAADGRIACGRVYVVKGGAGRERTNRAEDVAQVIISGGASGDCFGSSILAGPVDSGGSVDLLVSAPGADGPGSRDAGAVYLVTSEALARTGGQATISDVAAAVILGENAGDALSGLAIGDTNGDGRREALLGACQADGPTITRVDAGKVYLLPSDRLEGQLKLGPNEAIAVGPKPRGLLGGSIAAGDVDSDGLDDVIVSAHTSRGTSEKEDASGEVFLIFGTSEGLGGLLDLSTADVPSFRSRARWDLLGLPVLCADLSGDGTPDIVLAAQFSDFTRGSRKRCGEVYVFRGGLRSVLKAKAGSADLADVTIVGAREFEALGGSLLAAPLIGDAKADLVIGSPDAAGVKNEPRWGKVTIVAGEQLLGR